MSAHTILTAQIAKDCIVDPRRDSCTKKGHAIWGVLFERQQQNLTPRPKPSLSEEAPGF